MSPRPQSTLTKTIFSLVQQYRSTKLSREKNKKAEKKFKTSKNLSSPPHPQNKYTQKKIVRRTI